MQEGDALREAQEAQSLDVETTSNNTFASSVFRQLGQRVAQRFWDVCATGDPKRARALSEVDGRAEGTFTRPAVKTNR